MRTALVVGLAAGILAAASAVAQAPAPARPDVMMSDFEHMTRIAVARNWRLASAEQQATLVALFRTLLVRTYSSALSSYRDERIEYKPLRLAAAEPGVVVRSVVRRRGAAPPSETGRARASGRRRRDSVPRPSPAPPRSGMRPCSRT